MASRSSASSEANVTWTTFKLRRPTEGFTTSTQPKRRWFEATFDCIIARSQNHTEDVPKGLCVKTMKTMLCGTFPTPLTNILEHKAR